jgi:hypothetical protein
MEELRREVEEEKPPSKRRYPTRMPAFLILFSASFT